MYLKHSSTLWCLLSFFLPFLFGLCTARALSAEQVSFLPISQKGPDAIREALKQAHIIPDTLDDFVPSCYLHIVYTSSHEKVWPGDKIKPSHTKKAPVVRISCPSAEAEIEIKGFTVALTDPDAPSRKNPEWSEMCHWIVTVPSSINFLQNGGNHRDERHQGSREVIEYKPPGPPSKTGYHRYVFVLLEGDNTNLTAPSEREHWGMGKERHGVRDWAKREGLQVVGANFFYARDKKQ